MQLSELIAVLVAEGESSQDELLAYADLLGTLDEADAPEDLLDEAARSYADFCRRASAACASLELEGLTQIAQTLADGVEAMSGLPLALRSPASPLLRHWPKFFISYLQGWSSGAIDDRLISELLGFMAEAEYVTPLDAETLLTLGALLLSPPSLEAQADAMRPTFQPLEAQALVLSIPPDAERDLVDGFLAEAPKLMTQVATVVTALQQGPVDDVRLDVAHRSAHTLKGTAAIVGVRGIVTLAHALEDVLEAWRRPAFEPPLGLLPVLQAGCDQLDMALEHLSGMAGLDPGFAPVCHAMHAWAAQLTGQDVPSDALELNTALIASSGLAVAPTNMAATPGPQVSSPSAVADDEVNVRISAKALDTVFRALNELSVGLLRLRTECEDAYARCGGAAALELGAIQRVQELEQRVVVAGWGRQPTSGGLRTGAPAQPQGHDFDALELDRYNELTGLAQSLHEAVGDLRLAREELMPALRELSTLTQRQLQLAREAQYQVAKARLYPLSDLRTRLRRTVRQTGAVVGREVALDIAGDELRVDAAVLAPLADALLHLLRNSVDHGIEPPDERLARGKPPQGSIRIHFSSQNSGVLVRVSDDGRGLDYNAIRAKAVRNSLIATDAVLTPEQTARLIFLPGFSTRDQVTEISGRGVGLDVVAQTVAELQGQVSVQSTPGAGTEFRVFVLASIGTIHALHVQSEGEDFLIPSAQLLRAEPAPLHLDAEVDAEPTPTLAHILHGVDNTSAHQPLPVLVLEVDGQLRRIAVDRVVQAREFLIAPPPSLIGRLGGVSGIATLNDGSLGLVLDLIDLTRHPLPVRPQGLRRLQAEQVVQRPVLVVDDSLSVRNTLGSLLRDAGLPVVTARDGLEAIQLLQAQLFALVFTDLEMPRVNGFELTEYIRQRSAQPELPVIILTSRGQDKHRQYAKQVGVTDFIVKPYTDENILQQARRLLRGA